MDKQPSDELGRLYARAVRESSPAAVDARILAEARRAVAKPRAGNPFQGGWKVPLSMAAVLVIGLAVILDVQRQPESGLQTPKQTAPADQGPLLQTEEDVLFESGEDTSFAAEPSAKKREAAPAAESVQTESSEMRAQQPAPTPELSAPATPQQDFAPAHPQRQREILQKQEESAERMSDAPIAGEAAEMEQSESRSRSAPAATLAPSSAASGQASLVLPVEEWIAHIRNLIAQGELAAARAQLQAFRRAYPDYSLDEELQGLLTGG